MLKSSLLQTSFSRSSRSPYLLSAKIGQSVFLGLLILIFTGCRPEARGPKKVTVDALWVKCESENKCEGGTSPLTIEVDKGTGDKANVSVSNAFVEGSGSMWVASAWMSVVQSSILLGKDINQYDFDFDVETQIDGPSAGGLMTVAVLSLLNKDRLKPDISMTGTINPDGTIGPVSGIPQKVEGAHKQGKKLILIPKGQRQSVDKNNDKLVDVIAKGQELGIEVQEVGNIYEAYEAMTGEALRKTSGGNDETPELSSAAFDQVKAKVSKWQSLYQESLGELVGLGVPDESPFIEFVERAKTSYDKSNSLLNEGKVAGAYAAIQEATFYIAAATELGRLVNIYQQQGSEAVDNRLQVVWKSVETRLDSLLNQLKARQPKSSTDAVVLTHAYANWSVAQGLVDLSKETLQNEPTNQKELERVIFFYVLAPTLAKLQAQIAEDSLEFLGNSQNTLTDAKKLEGFAHILEQAATANKSYFEAVVLDQVANAKGINAEALKQEFRYKDFDYAFARAALNVLPNVKEKLSGEAASYATLGAALASYQFSSGLVAKYYSLGTDDTDGDGSVDTVKREGALIDMLDFADRQARESIAQATKKGEDPSLAVLAYQSAKLAREGGNDSKLRALQSFWTSSLEANLMTVFSDKNAKSSKKDK